jgi:alkylation response protein AidB-like acyl-CoA dehydrogenase
MHATVVSFWSCYVDVPSDFKSEWERQCEEVFSGVKSGAWWGTITSEPGSGGDIRKSKAKAKKVTDSEHYELFGQKHFGSGCGASDFMITTAVPEDDENPDWFIVPMPPQPLDANVGVKIVAPWDGQGMAATQSHSIEFCGAKASRIAAPGNMLKVIEGPRGAVACAYSAVFVGIADEAMAQARTVIAKNQNDLDSFSRVEWVRAKKEAWLIQQAYEGMLNGMANEQSSAHTAQLGKLSIAELAESLLQRISHILGGSAYSRKSPFGFWLNDVRALGFLRPPWPLAYQRIFDAP